MANAQSLLERLRSPADIERRTMGVDRRALVASVALNLRQILNSRQGSALAQMDLGVPAPCEIVLSMPESIGRLKNTIVEVISKYEPRLVEVEAFYQPGPVENLMMNFIVSGRLRHDGERISFETRFDKSGLIHLDA